MRDRDKKAVKNCARWFETLAVDTASSLARTMWYMRSQLILARNYWLHRLQKTTDENKRERVV